MSYELIRGDATSLPLADDSVDLICTSPPYFALRSYTDQCPDCGGSGSVRPASHQAKECPNCGRRVNEKRCHSCGTSMQWPKDAPPPTPCATCDGKGGHHYEGQIGSEATPQAFLEALWAVTAECVRVLKPSGSLWVNLGDKYSGSGQRDYSNMPHSGAKDKKLRRVAGVPDAGGIPAKSLMLLPQRYAIGCIDQLGLICRAEVIWSKPNGLPESVTDRVRRSHEQWFHFTKEPRYFSAVDEVREESRPPTGTALRFAEVGGTSGFKSNGNRGDEGRGNFVPSPLGKLPGSVWTVPTEPLRVPDHLGVDHFAAFPSEWPRRIILGWSPSGVCVACGEGRRPVYDREIVATRGKANRTERDMAADPLVAGTARQHGLGVYGHYELTRTGYACACPDTTAPTRPAVILDPFSGTGTTAAVAHILGRHGIGIDLSADYLRLAEWRCNDPALRAKVLRVDKPQPVPDGQLDIFGGAA